MQTTYLGHLKRISAAKAAIAALQRLNVANTKTNKEVNRLENEFNSKIEKMFNTILADHKTSFTQIQDLQARYGGQVRGLIRTATEQIYRTGAEYAGRVMKEDNVFLSTANVQTISRLTDNTFDFFWRQVSQHVRNYESQKAQEQIGLVLNPLRLLNIPTSAALVFNALSTAVLAIATIQKAKELRELRAPEQYIRTDESPLARASPDKVVFVTENDEKVCPICEPIDGAEWYIDDPLIIVPKNDTHPNCRCRLLLKTEEKIYSM